METSPDDVALKRSLLILRRIIGYCGFALAPICALTSLRRDHEVLGSISAYFFSAAHDAFVAILFMLAVTLWSYVGYAKVERYIAGFAGTCAAVVALSPTEAPFWAGQVLGTVSDIREPQLDGYVSALFERDALGMGPTFHNVAAVMLFGCFLLFSGSFFMRTNQSQDYPAGFFAAMGQVFRELWEGLSGRSVRLGSMDEAKVANNVVFRWCAFGILAGMLWAVGANVLEGQGVALGWMGVFLAEVIALVSFGYSWIRKSESEFGAIRRLIRKAVGTRG